MNARLRWKLEPRSELAPLGARSSKYCDGKVTYAVVCWSAAYFGWFWVAGWKSTVPYKNTSETACKTVEEAKKQAEEYVRAALNKIKTENKS